MSRVVNVYRTFAATNNGAADYVSGVSANDSIDLATAANTLRNTEGLATIAVSPRFNTSGASCNVNVIFYTGAAAAGAILGVITVAATAGLYREAAAGLYLGETLVFDTQGATQYEIRIDTISAGEVDLVSWEY